MLYPPPLILFITKIFELREWGEQGGKSNILNEASGHVLHNFKGLDETRKMSQSAAPFLITSRIAHLQH